MLIFVNIALGMSLYMYLTKKVCDYMLIFFIVKILHMSFSVFYKIDILMFNLIF